MANYTEWARLVNLFRGKSPNIAKAFDEAKKHSIRQDAELTALQALVASLETPPAPPPSSLLAWAPPTLYPVGSNLVQWTMTNANRQSGSLTNGGGRDLVITSGEVLTGPVISLGQSGDPWRNIVWIGGQINIPQSGIIDNYALPFAATGTAHFEGLDIGGDGVSDGMMTRGGGASTVVQIQNCRVQVHIKGPDPSEHADCFQFQGGTKIDHLRFDKCTFITDYQGLMLRLANSDGSGFCNDSDFRRLNFRRRVAGVDPTQAYIFIPDEDSAMGETGIGPVVMSDVWIEHNTSSTWNLYPDKIFSDAFVGGGNFSNRHGIFQLSDATSTYYRPSTTSDVVPAGGPVSGQSCLPGWGTSAQSGIVRVGIPSGGDYAPSGLPGLSYSSPGYLSVVACPGSASWSACFDGNWGNGTATNGWDGFNGNPNGGISSNGGYSFTNSYFSFVSSPSISGQAFKAFVDVNAVASGQAGERTMVQHWPYGSVTTDGKTQAYQGQEHWYRDFIYFPASYVPVANTSFNWVWEMHNWPDGPCCAYLTLGVVTNSEDGGAGGGERLSLRILGGGSSSNPVESTPGQNVNADPTPTGFTKTWVQGPSIQRDHWYDNLFRVKWDYTSAGLVEWYLDGTLMINYNGPTLYWYSDNNTNVGGSTAGPGLGYLILGNYRQAGSGVPSTVYHDTVLRGPTRASVGG